MNQQTPPPNHSEGDSKPDDGTAPERIEGSGSSSSSDSRPGAERPDEPRPHPEALAGWEEPQPEVDDVDPRSGERGDEPPSSSGPGSSGPDSGGASFGEASAGGASFGGASAGGASFGEASAGGAGSGEASAGGASFGGAGSSRASSGGPSHSGPSSGGASWEEPRPTGGQYRTDGTREPRRRHPAEEHFFSKRTWTRLVFVVLFAVAWWIAELVLTAVVVIQFLWVLFTGEPNEKLRAFGQSLSRYAYQIFRYMTFNSDERPFPFDLDWPSGTQDSTSG